MALFSKRQSDESWVSDVQDIYEMAKSIVSSIDEALESDFLKSPSIERFEYLLVQLNKVKLGLPSISENLKRVSEPTSSIARSAHKNLKNSLKSYNAGISSWDRFMSEYSGPVGQRLFYETGFAQRAAYTRISSSWNYFKIFAETGQKEFQIIEQYMTNNSSND